MPQTGLVPQGAATTQISARPTCALAPDSRRQQLTSWKLSPAENQEFGKSSMSFSSSEVALEYVSEFKDDADQDEKPSPQENKETVRKEELQTVETEVEKATTHNKEVC